MIAYDKEYNVNPKSWNELPLEVIVSIFHYMDVGCLLQFANTNTVINNAVNAYFDRFVTDWQLIQRIMTRPSKQHFLSWQRLAIQKQWTSR